MSDKPIGYLHIFSQHSWHDDARISGNRVGLEALVDALQHALKYGEAQSRSVFVNDGEGYVVMVDVASEKAVPLLAAPYYMTQVNTDISYWRERAFEAEAQLARQKKLNAEDIARRLAEREDED